MDLRSALWHTLHAVRSSRGGNHSAYRFAPWSRQYPAVNELLYSASQSATFSTASEQPANVDARRQRSKWKDTLADDTTEPPTQPFTLPQVRNGAAQNGALFAHSPLGGFRPGSMFGDEPKRPSIFGGGSANAKSTSETPQKINGTGERINENIPRNQSVRVIFDKSALKEPASQPAVPRATSSSLPQSSQSTSGSSSAFAGFRINALLSATDRSRTSKSTSERTAGANEDDDWRDTSNENIDIDLAEGNHLGMMRVEQALRLARSYRLDLVEISPNSKPPVCKIMDYAAWLKTKTQAQQASKKKQKEASKSTTVKEVRLSPTVADHDFEFKMKQVLGFLEEKRRVRVFIPLKKGQESHHKKAKSLLDRATARLLDVAKLVSKPRAADEISSDNQSTGEIEAYFEPK